MLRRPCGSPMTWPIRPFPTPQSATTSPPPPTDRCAAGRRAACAGQATASSPSRPSRPGPGSATRPGPNPSAAPVASRPPGRCLSSRSAPELHGPHRVAPVRPDSRCRRAAGPAAPAPSCWAAGLRPGDRSLAPLTVAAQGFHAEPRAGRLVLHRSVTWQTPDRETARPLSTFRGVEPVISPVVAVGIVSAGRLVGRRSDQPQRCAHRQGSRHGFGVRDDGILRDGTGCRPTPLSRSHRHRTSQGRRSEVTTPSLPIPNARVPSLEASRSHHRRNRRPTRAPRRSQQ
jgi:hypothetical protein